MKKIAFTFIGLTLVVILIRFLINDLQTFYSTMGGAAIGFLGALFIYQIGSHIDHLENEKINRENTLHVYQLYKDELNMNSKHLEDLIKKQWIPFYKLKIYNKKFFVGPAR